MVTKANIELGGLIHGRNEQGKADKAKICPTEQIIIFDYIANTNERSNLEH